MNWNNFFYLALYTSLCVSLGYLWGLSELVDILLMLDTSLFSTFCETNYHVY